MKYDPQNFGARCDLCPLGPNGCLAKDDWEPVGPEIHKGAKVLAIAESPGPEEVLRGRPLMGRNGAEWQLGLSMVGKTRPDIDLTYVVECKPPGQSSGAWSRMNKKLDQINKKRVNQGDEPWLHPMVCCRPRLLNLADTYENIITLGRVATYALTNKNRSIHSVRGGPMRITDDWELTDDESAPYKAMPTVQPDYILRSPAWRPVFHSDLGKAFRWFDDALRWEDPDVTWRPTPNELREWLAQPAPFWAYDVETDGIIATECGLRTIAIAIPDLDAEGRVAKPQHGRPVAQNSRAIGITLAKAGDGSQWYSDEDHKEIKQILREAFVDGRTWVGHNAGSFDRLVIEHHFDVTPAPLVDTLFATRFRAPDLPKSLKTVGSVLLDVERWETTTKGESISTGSTDDDELLFYNCIDSTVNARLVWPLFETAEFNGAFRELPSWARPASWAPGRPFNLHELDHATQDMCVNMHKNGVWVDQRKRKELEDHYTQSVKERHASLVEEARGHFTHFDNPGSGDQVRRLLYSVWKLGIPAQMDSREFYTDSGLPGTGDAVIRAHLATGNLTGAQEDWLKSLRIYRRERNKILGTVLVPMRRRDMDPAKGIVFSDGRVRSNWNAHVTSVGRLSSSGPNLQNIGNRKGQGPLKAIFAAPKGRMLIGADLDQAHLRITASYWRIPLLLECFAEGKDPHNTLAYEVFGDKFKNASGWGPEGFSLYRKPQKGEAKSMRDITKTFRYASIYWANPATVWQVLTSTETDDGALPYLGMSVREVRFIHEKWMRSEPEWMEAWQRMLEEYRKKEFMEEPVLGRRSGLLSDGKKNEVVNFPILAAESSVMRLAEHRIMEAFPFGFAGPGTGMIHQCHDSITVEVPDAGEKQLEEWKNLVQDCMTWTIPGWHVTMTSEAAIGRTLKEV
jgi:uracil-DNA glycosylase